MKRYGFGLLSLIIALAIVALLSTYLFTRTSEKGTSEDIRLKAIEDARTIKDMSDMRVDDLNNLIEE